MQNTMRDAACQIFRSNTVPKFLTKFENLPEERSSKIYELSLIMLGQALVTSNRILAIRKRTHNKNPDMQDDYDDSKC